MWKLYDLGRFTMLGGKQEDKKNKEEKQRTKGKRVSVAFFPTLTFLVGGSAKKRGKDYQGLCSIDIVPQGFIPVRKQIFFNNRLKC